MKDMAKNTTAANRGQTRKPATRKQEQPPTGATAGMKPEHQTGATDRNTTKNRTIAAAGRDHAADPVSIQGKPEIGIVFRLDTDSALLAKVYCGTLHTANICENHILIYAAIVEENKAMIEAMLQGAKR